MSYNNDQFELENLRQCLYDAERQLKLKESLLFECQGEIEHLKNAESVENNKLKEKIASVEEASEKLRISHAEDIACLESDLFHQTQKNVHLETEIKLLKAKASTEISQDVSSIDETKIINENQLLKEECEELKYCLNELQQQRCEDQKKLEVYQQELLEIKEHLQSKQHDLSEKSALIDQLSDEVHCLKFELDKLKNAPLQEGSKGNSLFAEVDDRRVHLQKTLKDMKQDYLRLLNERANVDRTITMLRRENIEIRREWKKDMQEIQDDRLLVNKASENHIKVLEDINLQLKEQLEDKTIKEKLEMASLSKDFHNYQFWSNMLNEKIAENKKLEDRMHSISTQKFWLARDLAQANKQVKLRKLEIFELKEKFEALKEEKELQGISKSSKDSRFSLAYSLGLDMENERQISKQPLKTFEKIRRLDNDPEHPLKLGSVGILAQSLKTVQNTETSDVSTEEFIKGNAISPQEKENETKEITDTFENSAASKTSGVKNEDVVETIEISQIKKKCVSFENTELSKTSCVSNKENINEIKGISKIKKKFVASDNSVVELSGVIGKKVFIAKKKC